ncbi:hypothetical protein RFI_27441 [Reticulomyxa filosa]|uniref:Uncharacterized protein n=1 Tax=Reticulomyxa filosa TaxID=46433 RepID=X6MA90_RETFI|nr:hypothetical protein RFI_27441 [Reticulomyxa filosa]|eukprot:ETO09935.1 hypothetical protein RFI_27441 [Reticulomyxa filosa]
MTNQDLFEFYKEHHRRNSLTAPSIKHGRSESSLTVDEHKVDESSSSQSRNSQWIPKVEAILQEQMRGVKQMIRSEMEQLGRDLVNSTTLSKHANPNSDGPLQDSNQHTVDQSQNIHIEQALHGVEALLDKKLQDLVSQILESERDAQSNMLVKVLQDQIEEYKSKVASATANANKPQNSENTEVVTLPSSQQLAQLTNYFEKSDENIQGLTREMKQFLEEMRSNQERPEPDSSARDNNPLFPVQPPSSTNGADINETLRQMTTNVSQSLQGISKQLEQLKLENTKILEENERIKEQNRDLIETVKELTNEKDELAENKRVMMQKLNEEMNALRRQVTEIGKQQMQFEMDQQARDDRDQQSWLGGLFKSPWMSL